MLNQLLTLVVNPSAITIATAGFCLLGALIWWLIRKRQKRIWLPTVRILHIESRRLPKLIFALPPLLAFFAFFLGAATLSFFSFSPAEQIFTPFEPEQARYHFFVDLSPSNAAYGDFNKLKSSVLQQWSSLEDQAQLSLSSSQSAEVFRPKARAELEAWLEKLDFHRGGARIGTALKYQLEDIGSVDRLLIFSDGDSHSWTGFNWNFLSDEMDVFWSPPAVSGSAKQNYYIEDVSYFSSPASPLMEWDVRIVRKHSGVDTKLAESGRLSVVMGSATLAEKDWEIPSGRSEVNVRIGWRSSKIHAKDLGQQQNNFLTFLINPPSSDAIALDNEFRTRVRGVKQDGILVSASEGEMVLEDPAHHLQHALEVLGFRLRRQDRINQPGPDAKSFPFWVILGGTDAGIDDYCPKSIETLRIAMQSSQGAKDWLTRSTPIVWLAPQKSTANYRDMCWCHARLINSDSPANQAPAYCKDVASRESFIGVLNSVGAKQVGGSVEDVTEALAFHSKDKVSGIEVLTFTLPLKPSRITGISYARLPVMVQSLLRWFGLITDDLGKFKTDWPRLSNVADQEWQPRRSDAALISLSNVPRAESQMKFLSKDALPPIWVSSSGSVNNKLAAKKDQSDPLPWLKICAVIIIFILALEGFYLTFVHIRKLKQASAVAILGGLLAFASGVETARAEVGVNLLNYSRSGQRISSLAREVSRRTSIDVQPVPVIFDRFDNSARQQGWLWVKNVNQLRGRGGAFRGDLAAWLKRGGFLVVEGYNSVAELNRVTAKVFGDEDLNKSLWQPIPPDHELMRSFHLLDSLPICRNLVWQGFHFDGRLAILAVPYNFLDSLLDQPRPVSCEQPQNQERNIRIFINLLMVVLATDYKKDQIHLPEILKRLR